MTNAAMRQELHHFIDNADDATIAALYNLVQNGRIDKYTDAELAEFYSLLEKYNKGEMPGFSVAETHDYVRANRKGGENILSLIDKLEPPNLLPGADLKKMYGRQFGCGKGYFEMGKDFDEPLEDFMEYM